MYSTVSAVHLNSFDFFTKQQISAIHEKYTTRPIVFTASSFDLAHAGHALMLEDCKNRFENGVVVIGLHSDPTINRDTKNKPVQSIEERRVIMRGSRYVDEIIEYATEDDLASILTTLKPALRVLGSDWRGKQYTGIGLDIPVYFHERAHEWSTSRLRKRVYEAEKM
jgi:glycerol-3-phosphate cytidylyltransferase